MDDTNNTMSFITNRLSLIIPPASAKPVKAKAKKKASRKSRAVVLKDFVNLPLDIIYETVAYLEPLDLLTLARLSKEFRALFMSRSSLFIWRRVLGEVPDLPPCPQDLSEPQYASLMFEKFCMACGSSRGIINSDYKTRLRLCTTCSKANLIHGYELRARYPGYQDVVLTMLPFYASTFWSLGPKTRLSAKNDLHMMYFKPEAELLISELAKHEDTESDAYTRFVAQEQENASRMIGEGLTLHGYEEDLVQAREAADEDKTERRYLRLKEEMLALGWEEQYFPRWSDEDDFYAWEKYMNQPKEFSARGWSLIRPKLAAIYNHTKKCRQVESLAVRTVQRYNEFRADMPNADRRRLPMWGDLLTLDFMMLFFWENHTDCSEEKLDDLMNQIVDETAVFIEFIEHDLAQMITACDPAQILEESPLVVGGDSDSEGDGKAMFVPIRTKASASSRIGAAGASANDKGKGKAKASGPTPAWDMLQRAANVFMCHCPPCNTGVPDKRRVFSYPSVVDHVNEFAYSENHWKQAKPETNMDLIQAARDVLAALGLEEDCTRDEVNALGKFVCDCHHYLYEGPLSFDLLVEHVFNQQIAYKRLHDRANDLDETYS
ncbi:hypothetical protein BJ912DRAFT_468674 [Pholiota molesta]|nr:hypothetical protein BJ912DRAFT_468674 [Pholiota molesta]